MTRPLNVFVAAIATACTLAARSPALAAERDIILATTTSTQDSGLLDVLVPAFEKKTGYFVKTISVGSGQAIAMGRKGEADVLLVHAPDDEKKLVEDGFGVHRRIVMHNDFVLVGPPDDPAAVRGLRSSEALARIAGSGARFVSRGDGSGTHAKEKGLWKVAGIDPEKERWYQQTGLGMGDTLNVASEKGAYTLADRGTYLARQKARQLALRILVDGEPLLLNVYHVVEVNPARWPKVNAAGARAFAAFVVSAEAQALIGRFGVDRVGSPLFFPDAGRSEDVAGGL